MLTPEDKDLLAKKGISEQQIIEQLACFVLGDFHGIVLDGFVSFESQADKLIVLSQNLCGGTAEVQTNLSDICPQIVYAE